MKPSPAAVRPATLADIPSIVRAYEWLFAPPGKRPARWDESRAEASLRRAISSPESTVWVASTDRELIGILTVYLDIDSVRFGPRAWVEDLAVHPEHRSRGLGKLLLDEAKDWARARGATHLELESSEGRVDAHRFYERESPVSRAKCFHWNLL